MSATSSTLTDAVFLNDPSHMAGSYGTALVADVKQALDVWVTHLSGIGTLTVAIDIVNQGQNGLLANAAPTRDAVVGTEDGRTLVQSGALYELSTGSHLGVDGSDITINVNAAYLSQEYLGAGDSVPAGQYDGLSLFEHEIAHGLGFGGFTSTNGTPDAQYETAWDHDLSSIGGTEVFTGANATAANGGVLVDVTTLGNGEGYAHLANSAADPNASDLMTGLGLPTGVRRPISGVDLAILADVGAPVTGMAGTVTIGVPAGVTAAAGVASSLGAITLSDTGAFTSSTLTLTLAAQTGVLSATRAGAGTVAAASNGHMLTLTGSLADVRTELASLVDTPRVAGTDVVQVQVVDSFGNTGAASVAVSTPAAVVASLAAPLPAVASLSATPDAAGPLGVGRTVRLVVATTAPVVVAAGTGTVGLALNDGGTAAFDAAASTSTRLVFDATVAAGQNAANLAATGLTLAGGATIAGANGAAASLRIGAATPGNATGLVVDTLAPAAPGLALDPAGDTGASHADGITRLATPILDGTAEAGSTVVVADARGGAASVLGTATASADGTWSLATPVLADGAHALSATATDAAGNVSAPSAILALLVDTAAPAAPTLTLVSAAVAAASAGVATGGVVAGSAAPTFAGTAEAGSTVTLLEGAAVVGTAIAASNGAWSALLALPLAFGTTVLDATATDAAGNVSAASRSLDVVLDAPAAAASSSPAPVSSSSSSSAPAPVAASSSSAPTAVAAGVSTAPALALPVPAANPSVVTLNGAVGQTQTLAAGPGSSFVVVNGGTASITASADAGATTTVFANGGATGFSNGGGAATVVANGSSSLLLNGGLSSSTLLAFTGAAATSYVGGAGADEIIGGAGAMSLTGGTGGSLLVFGGTGTLTLDAGGETDTVIGGAGAETIHAGVGAVFAGTGGSVLFASGAGTFLAGNTSGDRLQASAAGGDILAAGTGNETLDGAGSAAANLVFGGPGSDSVSLGLGADSFAGGAGGGVVHLGAGNAALFLGHGAANVVVATAGSTGGTDTVAGFRVGTDHLQLTGYAKPATLTSLGSTTTLGLVDGTRIVLTGVAATNAAVLLA